VYAVSPSVCIEVFFREIAAAKNILAQRHFRSEVMEMQIKRLAITLLRNEYGMIESFAGLKLFSSEQIALPVCCLRLPQPQDGLRC
jgi:hypothetical protein